MLMTIATGISASVRVVQSAFNLSMFSPLEWVCEPNGAHYIIFLVIQPRICRWLRAFAKLPADLTPAPSPARKVSILPLSFQERGWGRGRPSACQAALEKP